MGRRILELAVATGDVAIGGAFEAPALAGRELVAGGEIGRPQVVRVSADGAAELAKADVLIDFTVSDACIANVHIACTAQKPAVIGTTGLGEAQKRELASCARTIPIVYAPNMSVGMNLLFKLTCDVARLLGPEYNVEIIEVHHNQKKDSPSGSAARLAECAAEALGFDADTDVIYGREGLVGARPARQIGVHAVRGGDIIGEHTVCFLGQGERLELRHRAHNRDNFARGALRAARFVLDAKPGLYDMQDVLGLR
jgi:4-hydroxy-tetrahydrodipicolinate reductase